MAAKSNTLEAIRSGASTFGNSSVGSTLLNSPPGPNEALENQSTTGATLPRMGAVKVGVVPVQRSVCDVFAGGLDDVAAVALHSLHHQLEGLIGREPPRGRSTPSPLDVGEQRRGGLTLAF